MEELLSLKWNNHKAAFINLLAFLKDKQLYTDATLACEGKFYSVHKFVLSTCSDYFCEILGWIKCKEPVIVLKDIKCKDLEALLDYMYLGEVNVKQSELANLIKTADCLHIKGLAVADDDHIPWKSREILSRRSDASSSPPRKRKRCNDAVNVRQDHRQTSHSPYSGASKSNSIGESSTYFAAVNNKENGDIEVSNIAIPSLSDIPLHHLDNSNIEHHSINNRDRDIQDESDQAEAFVKVEMDDIDDCEVESYNTSNDMMLDKEVVENSHSAEECIPKSESNLDSNMPDFLKQTLSESLEDKMSSHTAVACSTSSYQSGDLPIWQDDDGSDIGFPLTFIADEESSHPTMAPYNKAQREAVHHQQGSTNTANEPSFTLANDAHSLSRNCKRYTYGRHNTVDGDKCPHCDRLFLRMGDLKRHLATHSGLRPYACPYCSYSFSRKDNLKRHIAKTHGN